MKMTGEEVEARLQKMKPDDPKWPKYTRLLTYIRVLESGRAGDALVVESGIVRLSEELKDDVDDAPILVR